MENPPSEASPPSKGGPLRPDHITRTRRAARHRRLAEACLLVGLAARCGEEPPAPAAASQTPAVPEPPRLVACAPEVARLLVELGAGGSIVAADSISLGEIPGGAAALDLGPGCASAPDAASGVAPALAVLLGGAGDEALAAALAQRGVET